MVEPGPDKTLSEVGGLELRSTAIMVAAEDARPRFDWDADAISGTEFLCGRKTAIVSADSWRNISVTKWWIERTESLLLARCA